MKLKDKIFPKEVKPKTIKEAIDDLHTFLVCDVWFACKSEWKKEDDMIKYINAHFKILQEQVKKLTKKNPKVNKDV